MKRGLIQFAEYPPLSVVTSSDTEASTYLSLCLWPFPDTQSVPISAGTGRRFSGQFSIPNHQQLNFLSSSVTIPNGGGGGANSWGIPQGRRRFQGKSKFVAIFIV